MPAVLEAMRRELEDAAAHLGKPHDLRFKPMFGGLMAYLDEQPCAWLTAAGLALNSAGRSAGAASTRWGVTADRETARGAEPALHHRAPGGPS